MKSSRSIYDMSSNPTNLILQSRSGRNLDYSYPNQIRNIFLSPQIDSKNPQMTKSSIQIVNPFTNKSVDPNQIDIVDSHNDELFAKDHKNSKNRFSINNESKNKYFCSN